MRMVKIFKALSNEARLQILQWLREPGKHFAAVLDDPNTNRAAPLDADKNGVYVGLIQQKSGLSQSTISHYLALLQEAGLVQAQRMGQWTYYRRNEEAISAFLSYITNSL